jgi:DNA-binding response OmpR family regulator
MGNSESSKEESNLKKKSRRIKKGIEKIGKNLSILLVEDNEDIRNIIKNILEYHAYEVFLADNGNEALNLLSEMEKIPDLIISDIMMPNINGYEFFKTVSNNPKYLDIPFIFLSALDSPEDIRLGKLLGVDDYLTKPVNEDDLLATIAGKISRNKKRVQISDELKEFFLSQESEMKEMISDKERNKVYLLRVDWDDKLGPNLIENYPEKSNLPLEKIANQLFQAITTIYGQHSLTEAGGILVNIENFKISGYSLFDSYIDKQARGGHREFMLAVIAPNISYFQSLQLKKILLEMSTHIKQKKEMNFKDYWEKISDIVTSLPLQQ